MIPPLSMLVPVLLSCQPPPGGADGDAPAGGADSGGVEDGQPYAELVSVSEDYAHLGLELRTYDIQNSYTDLQGLPPRFYVFLSLDLAPGDAPHPTLVWLHGGVGALPDDPDFGQMCTAEGTEPMAVGSLPSNRWLSTWLARSDWIAIVPHSPWCDMWSGLGPDDPVSEDHRSVQHAEDSLALLAAGLDGVAADLDAVSTWGVSAGGVGSLVVGQHLHDQGIGLRGVVSDSGPWDLVGAHSAAGGTDDDLSDEWLEGWFGGPPVDSDGTDTPWRANYDRVDGPTILAADRLPVPVLAAWNRHDRVSPRHSGEALFQAAEAVRDAGGPRHLVLDTARFGPGDNNHVQLSSGQLVRIWGPVAGTDAMQGRALHYAEADAACAEEPCALRSDLDDDESNEALVGTDGLYVLPSDGARALVDQPWPAAVPRDRDVRLRLAADLTVALPEDVSGGDAILELRLRTAEGTRTVHSVAAGPVVTTPQTTDAEAMAAHVGAFTVELSPEDLAGDDLHLEVHATGRATLRLDGLWWSWMP